VLLLKTEHERSGAGVPAACFFFQFPLLLLFHPQTRLVLYAHLAQKVQVIEPLVLFIIDDLPPVGLDEGIHEDD
jgi:hypothetical protein